MKPRKQRNLAGYGIVIPMAFFISCQTLLSVAGGAERRVSVIYDFDTPQIKAADGYVQVTVPKCNAFQRKGAPVLPFRTARILLPPACNLDSVSIELLEQPQTLDGKWTVEFGRTPVPIGITDHPAVKLAAQDRPDPNIYGLDKVYPESSVQLVSVQRMNGYSIAIIRLFPVQYVPAKGQLIFCSRVRVDLVLSPEEGKQEAMLMLRTTGPIPARVAAFVDNPEGIEENVIFKSGGTRSLGTYDYLLITTDALMSSFQPLVDQKISAGLSVKTETVENILANYSGVDNAEKLRNFIKYAYTSWQIEYVLLGGDVSTVPFRGAYAYCSGADNSMPCDLYFSCLDGSWNRDGDSLWGEPNDGEDGGDVDLLGEVYVGRAPVDTTAEVDIFVSKIVSYEQNGAANASNTRFLAEYLGYYWGVYAHGGDALDYVLPQFSSYTAEWLDDRPANGQTWGSTECLAALNSSPHIVPHVGHANTTYAMRLYNSSLDSLTNSEPFLIASVGCYCGAFDASDCIAEEFIKRNAHGAFAVLMNSRYGWFNANYEWKYSGEFMERFFYELLGQGNRNIGKANQLSKHDMVGSVETSGNMVYRWCYFELNLLGDPHTPLNTSDLVILPSTSFSPSGTIGGPFTPASTEYELTNTSSSAFDWTVSQAEAWLDVSPSSGTLQAGASTTVTATINTAANLLAIGTYSDNLVFTNQTSGAVQTRAVSLQVNPPPPTVIHSFDLDADPGWTTEGEWQFGQPLGSGSYNKDPTSGYTGTNVYGYNLAGDYTDNIPVYFLTTTPLNCSGYTNVSFVFWRWLGVENAVWDDANIQASNDGTNWTNVWTHTGSSISDSSWQEITCDISALADGQSTVYIRWGMGSTDSSVTFPGWNIDDVSITGNSIDDLNVSPGGGLTVQGYEQGPFDPSNKVYTLVNAGDSNLTWTATKTQPWLDVTPSSGSLSSGQTTDVTVLLNSQANSLAAGGYNDMVTFTRVSSGIDQKRQVSLQIKPLPPTGVSASDGSYTDKVRVLWSTVTDADSYRVFRATSSGGTKTAIGTWQAGTTYDDMSAVVGQICYYWVKAKNSYGESGFSSFNSGWKNGAKPGAPAGVSASDGTYTYKVRVQWNSVTGADSYRVFRATSLGGTKTALGTWQAGTTYDDMSAVVEQTYYYWVKAKNSYGESGFSSYETGWRNRPAPGAPIGLLASDGDFSDKVQVTWNAVLNATSYEVWRWMSFSSPSKLDDATDTCYNDTSAEIGIAYYYCVKAKNSSGTSDFSNSDSGWRQYGVPSAPTSVSASDGDCKLRVTWNGVSGSGSYEVWRNTVNDSSSAIYIGEVVSLVTTYDDVLAIPEVTCYYWVKAKNGSGTSEFSNWDSGWRCRSVSGDYDGDMKSDLAIYQSSTATWYIWSLTRGIIVNGETWGVDDGSSIAVPGDFDGDGSADMAVYHEATGLWYIRTVEGNVIANEMMFGATGYDPVSGNFDGDGKTDIAVYHEATGYWYMLLSGSGYSLAYQKFGAEGYEPVKCDFDGDGKTDLALYHEASGYWFIVTSGNGTLCYMKFGESGYAPVPGDFDGDSRTDLAVYHEATGYWYMLLSGSGYSLAYMKFGESGYAPVPGDYDGDGRLDLGVYQESSGYWFVLLSATGEISYEKFGESGYVPVH